MAIDLPLAAGFFIALMSSWNGVWQDIADRIHAGMEPAAPMGVVSPDGNATDAATASAKRSLGIVVAEGQRAGVDWLWHAGRVHVRDGPKAGGAFRVVLDEPQTLTMLKDGSIHRWVLDGESLDLRLATGSRGRITAATLTGENVTVVQGHRTFAATHLNIETKSHGSGEIRIALTVKGLTLPPSLRPPGPLARPLDQAHIVATISAIGRDPPATLTDWRDRGGSIRIVELALDWARFHLDATGRLELDDQLRPRGRVRLGLSGAPDAMRSAEAAGWVDGGARETIDDVLSRIAGIRGTQDINEVRLDLSLRLAGGRLNWQGLSLVTLPAIGTDRGCGTANNAIVC